MSRDRCYACRRRLTLGTLARVIVEPKAGETTFIDLCPVCSASWLTRFLYALSHEEQAGWLATELYPPDARISPKEP